MLAILLTTAGTSYRNFRSKAVNFVSLLQGILFSLNFDSTSFSHVSLSTTEVG